MNIAPFAAVVVLVGGFLIGGHDLQARTWTDASSGRTLEADYVSSNEGTITLKRIPGGQIISVPLSQLSIADQEFISNQEAEKSPSNKAEAYLLKTGKDQYEEVKKLTPDQIPRTGNAHRKLEKVDEAIIQFMADKGIPAVGFALGKGDQLLHERAFGWAEESMKTPLPVGMSMRLASISKPLTQAGIHTLIEDRKLKLDDKVFDVLELDQLKPGKLDERWRQISIAHLISHEGGWDRTKSGDATSMSSRVCNDLKIRLEDMQPMDLVRWYLEQPLDFDPGSRSEYCNFGYTLLARVIEKISGKGFAEYLNSTVGKVTGMTTLRVSRSDPQDRLPGEIWYSYFPEYRQEAKIFPVRMETKDGSGALACSAADYCRFLQHYTISGRRRISAGNTTGTFFGSTPGCTSACVQRADGIYYTVIGNRRSSGGERWNQELKAVIDKALEEVAAGL